MADPRWTNFIAPVARLRLVPIKMNASIKRRYVTMKNVNGWNVSHVIDHNKSGVVAFTVAGETQLVYVVNAICGGYTMHSHWLDDYHSGFSGWPLVANGMELTDEVVKKACQRCTAREDRAKYAERVSTFFGPDILGGLR